MSLRRDMSCRNARAFLPWFVGGDLSPDEVEPVRRHLRGCDGCRREAGVQLRALQAVRSLPAADLERLPTAEAPFFAALHADVLRSVASASQHPELAAALRSCRRPALIAAAVLLFVLGVWLAGPAGGLAHRAPIRPLHGVATPTATPNGVLLQPLDYHGLRGAATDGIDAFDGKGLGLMGRLQLRTLEERGGALLDPRLLAPRQARPGKAAGAGGLAPGTGLPGR